MFIVYILRTSGNTLYVGQTNNFEKRLLEHKNKKTGAKYLKYFSGFEVVHTEECTTRSEALRREYQLKKLTRKEKEVLIAGMLNEIRKIVKKLAPEAIETIAYGIPTFKLAGKNLVHFAEYKNHLGFYPTPPVIEKFANELKSFKKSKGAIQFPKDQKLPVKLIESMVKYRLAELK